MNIRRFFAGFKNNHALVDLIKITFYSFGVKVTAAIGTFLFSVVLTRELGVAGSGQYFLGFSVVSLGIVFGKYGIDKTLLRNAAKMRALNQWGELKGVVVLGFVSIAMISLIVNILMYFTSDAISVYIFDREDFGVIIRIFSFSIVPISLIYGIGETFKGMNKVPFGLSLYGVFIPLFSVIGIYLATRYYSYEIRGVIGSYVVSCVIVLIIAISVLIKEIKIHDEALIKPIKRHLFRDSNIFFHISIYQYLISFSSIFFLGIWATDESIGLFSVAKRIAMIMLLFHVAFTSAMAPKLGQLFAIDNNDAIKNLSRKMTSLILLLITPLCIVLLIYPEYILILFGRSFHQAENIFRVLLVGQFVNIAMGPVGQILILGGKEKLMRMSFTITVILTLVLNVLLIPRWGALGAALATSIAVITQNLISAYFVKREFDFYTVPLIRK